MLHSLPEAAGGATGGVGRESPLREPGQAAWSEPANFKGRVSTGAQRKQHPRLRKPSLLRVRPADLP